MELNKAFPAKLDALSDITAFVEEALEECDFSPRAIMQIGIAVEEIFVNIAHYAYPNSSGEMNLHIKVDDSCAILEFSDQGIPFDPLARENPDVKAVAESRAIGGLGIFMVKKAMDDVSYTYRDGKNILTITKNAN